MAQIYSNLLIKLVNLAFDYRGGGRHFVKSIPQISSVLNTK